MIDGASDEGENILDSTSEKKETMNKNGKDWDKGTEEINEIKIISIHWFNKLNQRRSHNERTN